MRKPIFLAITLVLASIINLVAQSEDTEMTKVKQRTVQLNNITKEIDLAVKHKDLNRFMSFYADSVFYSDPNYGVSGYYERKIIKQQFAPIFSKEWKIRFKTIASDIKESTIMILGEAISPKKRKSDFAVWWKLNQGKIIEQMDFTTYDIKIMLTSPRYKEYLKKQ